MCVCVSSPRDAGVNKLVIGWLLRSNWLPPGELGLRGNIISQRGGGMGTRAVCTSVCSSLIPVTLKIWRDLALWIENQ